eukprot:COSAG02_NODE_8958_length_2382_cov_11.174332_1_plen_460_part_10
MIVGGIFTCIGALLGSPFGTVIYIGHLVHKANGARTGYSFINSFINGVVSLILCISTIFPVVVSLFNKCRTGPRDHFTAAARRTSARVLSTVVLCSVAHARCNQVLCGGAQCTEEPFCASPEELHEVQCCSDADLGGWPYCFVDGSTVFSARQQGELECTHDATLAQAIATCVAVGARLCTTAEIRAGCGVGTGCGHNLDLLWTETCYTGNCVSGTEVELDGYNDNDDHEWTFTCNNSLDRVEATFDSLDVESGFDFVRFYDGDTHVAPQIGSAISGTAIPNPVFSTGQDMFMTFTSDYSRTGSGFSAIFSCCRACCAAGRYVDVAGSDEATDCVECQVGRYSSEVGSSSCISCAAGRYVDVAGSDEEADCISCAAGRYVDVAGSDEATDCAECQVGRYSSEVGNSSCISCAAGRYVDVAGSDEEADCISCAAGRYVDVAGSDEATDCVECQVGRYSAEV